MKCGKCEYKTGTEIPDTSSVAEKQTQLRFHVEFEHMYDTDTDNGDNYNARTLMGEILDKSHYGGCWEESEPCQGEVCRYDPEGEYDTDTGRAIKVKSPQPEIDQDQPLEVWETKEEVSPREGTLSSGGKIGPASTVFASLYTDECQLGQFLCLG